MRELKHNVETPHRIKNYLSASISVLLITLFTVAPPEIFAVQPQIQLQRSSSQGPATPRLQPGKPIEREIPPGGSHTYLITLKAGEFLRLSVDQVHVDIVLAISSPANDAILEMDSIFAPSEVLAIVARQPGDYFVEVRSKETPTGGGTYILRVEALRLPSESDLVLVAAIEAYREGIRLQQQKTAQSFPQAIKLYEAAREGFRKVNAAIFEAETLKLTGDSYSSLGSNEEAIDYFELALPILKSAGHEFGEATILTDMGFSCLYLSNYPKALESFDSALRIWIKRNNPKQQAVVKGELGIIYQRLGKMSQAESYFDQSLTGFDQLGKPFDFDRAVLLKEFGWFHYKAGKPQEALKYYSEALSIFERLNRKKEAASVLNDCGIAYRGKGEVRLAMESYEKALRFKRDVGDRLGEAVLLNNMGVVYNSIREPQKALNKYFQALPIHQEVKNHADEGYTLNNIGVLLDELGESQLSIGYQERAINIARSLSDKRSESNALHSLGVAYRRLGNLPSAMECFEEALTLRRALRDSFQEAMVLKSIGMLKVIENKFPEALDYYQQALSIFRSQDNRANEADILIAMGNAYFSLSSLDQATNAYVDALSISKDIEDKAREGEALHRLARVEVERGNFDRARPLIEGAIRIIEASRNTITNQRLKVAYFSTVRQFYEVYLDLLMQLHKRSGSPDLLAKAFEVSEQTRARSLAELIRESNIIITEGIDKDLKEREESLRQRIRAKSELYIRLRANGHKSDQQDSLQKEIGDLSLRYEEQLAEIRAQSPRFADLTQAPHLTLAEVQQRLVDKGTLLLEYSLGQSHSHLWVVSSDSIASFELPGRVQIEEAAERVKKLMVDYQEVPNENSAALQKRQANADRRLPVAMEELSKLVLAPAAHLLGKKRLLLVPDGALHYVPFAALPESVGRRRATTISRKFGRAKTATDRQTSNHSGGQSIRRPLPLIVNHEIVYLPSASVLDLIRSETQGRKVSSKKVAVFADPVFDERDSRIVLPVTPNKPELGESIEALRRESAVRALKGTGQGLPRLVFSREQAEAISALIPESASMSALGFDANRDKVLERDAAGNYRIGDYGFVHFATHGILNSEQPELSGIVLSLVDEQGNRRDGFLGLSDIYNMKLPVELVVLSACETGLGRNANGEGIIGLTRGFMYAGAKRVVASLWQVEDYSTSEFMKTFYEKMLKTKNPMRPAEALRATQFEMWKNGERPYQWAAFVIQGEWK